MSYSTLYVLDKDGLMQPDIELANAWGSGAFVWTVLCDKYRKQLSGDSFLFRDWGELIHRRDELPLTWYEYNVLEWSLDWSIVRVQDFRLFIESLEAFSAEHHGDGRRVNHMPAIARRLRELLEKQEGYGVGIWNTSVSDDPWTVYENDEDGYRRYDINKDEKHDFCELRRPDENQPTPEPKGDGGPAMAPEDGKQGE